MSCLFVQVHASLLAIASSEAPLCPMSGWVCQWKPFSIPVEDSFKKACMEEWVYISEYLLKDQALPRIPWSITQISVKSSPRLPGCRSMPLRHLGSLRSPMIEHVFGNDLRHHCLRCGHDQNVISFIHVSLVPFLSVWSCRFQMRLSCLVTKNSTPQGMIFLLHGQNERTRNLGRAYGGH